MVCQDSPDAQGFTVAALERVTGLGTWRMPLAERRIALSANASRLLGVEASPPGTLDALVALCHPQDQARLREACERLLVGTGEERFELDLRMQLAGREVWFRHQAWIEPGTAGSTPALLGVVRDVSRERQAGEDEAQSLRAQVQIERDRVKAAASAGIVGVWEWYIPEDILIWDEVMYRLYGLEPGDFGGAYEAWKNALHPDDQAGAAAALAAALRGEREYEFLFRVVWPSDGTTHFLKAGAQTIYDEVGRAVRMVGVNVDVTEQIARQETLEEAMRIAVDADRAKSDFLARMSHEIRTPMNAVIGLSAMGMELPDLPHRAADYMRRIHRSSTALMTILDDILDFSKIEAGQMRLDPHPFELEALFETSAELFALAAHQKGLRLVVDIGEGLPRFLMGDAPRLSQILNNLLGNAIKFTESGQVVLDARRLPTGEAREADHVRLRFTVQDTGIGIAPEKIGELFLPFSQANGSISRRYGGSGLGLAISQRLCELMGGASGWQASPEAEAPSASSLSCRLPRRGHGRSAGRRRRGGRAPIAPVRSTARMCCWWMTPRTASGSRPRCCSPWDCA